MIDKHKTNYLYFILKSLQNNFKIIKYEKYYFLIRNKWTFTNNWFTMFSFFV